MLKKRKILDAITVNSDLQTPKYKQIVYAIKTEVTKENLEKGDRLPSINELSETLYLSRDTIEKAYRELKSQGVISSSPGKGYFIENTQVELDFKVFLLFNKLSAHKKIIYDAFVEAMGPDASIDLYVYNNDYRLFEKLIRHALNHYSHYVIMPHFYEDYLWINETLLLLPDNKLLLLDRFIEGYPGKAGGVYQNFYQDIFRILNQNKSRIESQYKRMILTIPDNSYHPRAIEKGFDASDVTIQKQLVHHLNQFDVQIGDVFIVVEEKDLVSLIKKTRFLGLKIGSEVGILSYNESPLKEVLADGISVISTDFETMGKTCANLIKTHSKQQIENPFRLIERKSF